MRKSNSTDICDDFRQEIDDLLSFRTALLAGNVSKANQSLLAELVFHRGYVALESFLSAWFLACINRDSTQFILNRQQKIRDAITEQFGAWDNGKIAYSLALFGQRLAGSSKSQFPDPDHLLQHFRLEGRSQTPLRQRRQGDRTTDHGFAKVISFRDPDGNHITILEYGPEYW